MQATIEVVCVEASNQPNSRISTLFVQLPKMLPDYHFSRWFHFAEQEGWFLSLITKILQSFLCHCSTSFSTFQMTNSLRLFHLCMKNHCWTTFVSSLFMTNPADGLNPNIGGIQVKIGGFPWEVLQTVVVMRYKSSQCKICTYMQHDEAFPLPCC